MWSQVDRRGIIRPHRRPPHFPALDIGTDKDPKGLKNGQVVSDRSIRLSGMTTDWFTPFNGNACPPLPGTNVTPFDNIPRLAYAITGYTKPSGRQRFGKYDGF